MIISISKEQFIREFVRAIENDNAAIFAGAGLSVASGCCNWKTLLEEMANEIGLDVEKEYDLARVAQYYVNEYNGNRSRLTQTIIDKFAQTLGSNVNHKILSSLPIKTYWTTNYDNLIETALKENCKIVDVKKTTENLAQTATNRDVVVYKMHGDIEQPQSAVITKDDYDTYNLKRSLFTTKLCGDIVSKNFLFLGFSFEDQNLEHILSQIKITLENNVKMHYCLMKKVDSSEYPDKDTYEYDKLKQQLKIKDLKRYGINVILLDTYAEVTEILSKINNCVKRKNVFISGSAHTYGDWSEKDIYELVTKISNSLIFNGNNIISGYGLGIGSAVISGAITEIYKENKCGKIEQRLLLRPFPLDPSSKELWTKYRKDMISCSGIALFICGNKLDKATGEVIDANGMLEEFSISIENGVVPIPIATTEFVSRKIWNDVMNNFESYVKNSKLKGKYEKLGKEKDITKICSLVVDIINELQKGG